MEGKIILRGVRQNNLKGFDLEIPRGKFIVVTGVSGSGKSSLALDTLYAEGQRRYVESFSAYARQFLERMDRPAVSSVEGIPPAVAITQGNQVLTSRSTVGTVTEINDYVKLLFAYLGVRHCDRCDRPVLRRTPAQIFEELLKQSNNAESWLIGFETGKIGSEDFEAWKNDSQRAGFLRVWNGSEVIRVKDLQAGSTAQNYWIVIDRLTLESSKRSRWIEAIEQSFALGKGKSVLIDAAGKRWNFDRQLRCAHCDLRYSESTPSQFSFNTPVGACPECKGFGRTIEIDPNLVVPDPSRSLAEGAIKPWTTEKTKQEVEELHKFCRQRKVSLHTPWKDLPEETKRWVWEGEAGGWEAKKWYGIRGWFQWLESKIYKLHVRVLLSRYRIYLPCKTCGGTRFKKESLQTRLQGKNIAQLYAMPIGKLKEFFDQLEGSVVDQALMQSVATVLQEVRARLGYLGQVGLDYLTLDRSSRTLSGGEMQRVNLTTAVGSSLVNTLFVLDEPSVGLHPRDNERLIRLFRQLTERQNTVVVVEHDPAILLAADHLIDIGPKAGAHGGELIYQGSVSGVLKEPRSLTGKYLKSVGKKTRFAVGAAHAPSLQRNAEVRSASLSIRGARANNLKNLNVDFPLGKFSCVTGVSGSGKSSLVEEVLYRGILRKRGERVEEPGECKSIEGWEVFTFVSFVDQTALSKSPKSTIASYSGVHKRIGLLFSKTEEAKKRRFTPAHFSTGSSGGRCETCEGTGSERVEMQFLADLYLPCPDCGGARFKPSVLKVKYQGKNIREVSDLSLQQALEFFQDETMEHSLSALVDLGLGYLKLGQGLNTLSGGESQRLKLALALKDSSRSGELPFPTRYRGGLFLLDEPTTGLHGADLPPLITAFERLKAAGHTLIVIEHNLEIVQFADFVLDLGPEGGEGGGEIVAMGSPEEIAANPDSITGKYLQELVGGVEHAGRR